MSGHQRDRDSFGFNGYNIICAKVDESSRKDFACALDVVESNIRSEVYKNPFPRILLLSRIFSQIWFKIFSASDPRYWDKLDSSLLPLLFRSAQIDISNISLAA